MGLQFRGSTDEKPETLTNDSRGMIFNGVSSSSTKQKSQLKSDHLLLNFSELFAEEPQSKLFHSLNVCFLTIICFRMSKSISDFPIEPPNESGFQIFVLSNTARVRHIKVFMNTRERNAV